MTSSTDANGVATLVPHVKVWVEGADGQVALSEWRIALLERIEECGSLAEAARQLQIPYRTAWYKLHEMEQGLGCAVLVSHTGGSSGGGMRLTERARDAIRRYRCVTDGIDDLIAARFAKLFADF
jgi:molybdate transport system regulatory protein